MKLEARSEGWSGGPVVADVPAVAVLEVSGAVLEWTVDDPAGAAATRMTVTDVVAADYDRLIDEFKAPVPVRTIYADAEKLAEKFGRASFDIVFAQNCVDHM